MMTKKGFRINNPEFCGEDNIGKLPIIPEEKENGFVTGDFEKIDNKQLQESSVDTEGVSGSDSSTLVGSDDKQDLTTDSNANADFITNEKKAMAK